MFASVLTERALLEPTLGMCMYGKTESQRGKGVRCRRDWNARMLKCYPSLTGRDCLRILNLRVV